jgi:hypothetical protein
MIKNARSMLMGTSEKIFFGNHNLKMPEVC